MSEDFYPFVDSGDPAPDNTHLTGAPAQAPAARSVENGPDQSSYTIRISVYDDMLSTPRVIVVEQSDVRTYLEDVTNTVYRTMKEQGGKLSLMIIRELVENFIHAQFSEPVISILDNGNTIRFADQGPGIGDKERAFEFGVTSADRDKKRYIRGTGAGLPMVQQYVENAGGAIAVEDNLGSGTVVTVSVDPKRAAELEHAVSRGAAVRSGCAHTAEPAPEPTYGTGANPTDPWGASAYAQGGYPAAQTFPQQNAYGMEAGMTATAGMGMETARVGGVAPRQMGAFPPQQMPGGAPQVDTASSQQPGQYPIQQQGAFPHQVPAGYPLQQPGGYPQQMPYHLGYQQAYQHGHPQPQLYGMPGAFAPMGYPPVTVPGAQAAPQSPYVSERGVQALLFIYQNGKGGPTDLTRALGRSDATWSRELDTLASTGLVHKPRQKYVLTDMGKAWVEQGAASQ